MKFLIVDDELAAVQDLKEVLCKVMRSHEISGFTSPTAALKYLESSFVDVVFLDIEMGSTNGIWFAKKIKDLQPDVHIIFVTGYPQYAVDAFAIHATGYLVKPVMPEQILRELTFLYEDRIANKKIKVRIQTFGGFVVYANEKQVIFRRSKSKELLAYLVDRHGGAVTTRDACALLWEDKLYDVIQKNYFHQVLHDLRNTLSEAGIEQILIKKRNSLAIDPSQLDCDIYRFLEGDPKAVNSYRQNYLPEYSWAEFGAAILDKQLRCKPFVSHVRL